jgi:Protein of unknown function (DUF3352)
LRGTSFYIGVALVLATGAIASGCGSGGAAAPDRGLAALTPPDAPLFVQSVIHPNEAQSAAIDSFANRVGGISNPGPLVIGAVDDLFAQNGLELDYAGDIAPWIGDHAALFVSSFNRPGSDAAPPDLAVLVETSDEGAAADFLGGLAATDGSHARQRSYAGVGYDYFDGGLTGVAAGVFDGALVVGTQTAFKVAVDASQGESLADSADYTERTAALPDDPIASVFVEPAATIDAAIMSQGIDPASAVAIKPLLGGPLSDPVAATLSAATDAASIDVAAVVDSSTPVSTRSPLLGDLPGDSWLAVAVPDLGPKLERSLDQVTTSGIPGGRKLKRRIRARPESRSSPACSTGSATRPGSSRARPCRTSAPA